MDIRNNIIGMYYTIVYVPTHYTVTIMYAHIIAIVKHLDKNTIRNPCK